MGGDIVPVQPQSNYYEYYDANDGGAYGGAAPEQGHAPDAAYTPAPEPTHAAHQPLDPHAGKETVHLQFETQADDNQNDASEARTQAEANVQSPSTADQAEPVALDEVNPDTVTQPPAPAAGASITPDGDGQFKADHPVKDPTEMAAAKVAELGKVFEHGGVPTETGAGRIHEVAADTSLSSDAPTSIPTTPTVPALPEDKIVNHDKAASTESGSEPAGSPTEFAPLTATEVHVNRVSTDNRESRTNPKAMVEQLTAASDRHRAEILNSLVEHTDYISRVRTYEQVDPESSVGNPHVEFAFGMHYAEAIPNTLRTLVENFGPGTEARIVADDNGSGIIVDVPFSIGKIQAILANNGQNKQLRDAVDQAARENFDKAHKPLLEYAVRVAMDEVRAGEGHTYGGNAASPAE